MSIKIHFHHVFDLDFDKERARLESAWKQKPAFKEALLNAVTAIEKGDSAVFNDAWKEVKKLNPHPENKPVEYLDSSVVIYWSSLGLDKATKLEGIDALRTFQDFLQDSVFSGVYKTVESKLTLEP
jgi:hypothetical protein